MQDFGRGNYRKEPTLEVDDEIIKAVGCASDFYN